MTVVVPNWFLQERPGSIRSVGDLFVKRAAASTKAYRVRNTMHGLLVVLEGSKTLHYPGGKISLEAGSAAFFMHGNYFVSQNRGAYRAVAIYFDERFAARFAPTPGSRGEESERVVKISYKRGDVVSALAQRLWLEMDRAGEAEEPLFESRIETLFWELLALRPKEAGSFFSDVAGGARSRFASLLLENLDIIESVADMSRLLRMSPAHFHRRFKEEFRTSPKRWLESQRLEKGASLLKKGEMSVAQIAAECGYATPSSFIAAFKKHFKSTPKKYMIENRHF